VALVLFATWSATCHGCRYPPNFMCRFATYFLWVDFYFKLFNVNNSVKWLTTGKITGTLSRQALGSTKIPTNPNRYQDLFPLGKEVGAWSSSLQSKAEVTNAWGHTSIPQWCLHGSHLTEVLGENLPQRLFVHHKPTCWPDANPDRRSGKPVTNLFSYGMATSHNINWD
jgi:hypothetical protein